jgi:phage gp36-like protein
LAITTYCDRESLFVLGISAKALTTIPETQIDLALANVSRFMDGYLGVVFVLPITNDNGALKLQCAVITAYFLLSAKGFNPDSPGDKNLFDRYEAAIKWLEDVRDKKILPQFTDSSVNADAGRSGIGRPRVVTGTDRGYSTRQGDVYGPGWNQGD